jgi:hypothetical protein
LQAVVVEAVEEAIVLVVVAVAVLVVVMVLAHYRRALTMLVAARVDQ